MKCSSNRRRWNSYSDPHQRKTLVSASNTTRLPVKENNNLPEIMRTASLVWSGLACFQFPPSMLTSGRILSKQMVSCWLGTPHYYAAYRERLALSVSVQDSCGSIRGCLLSVHVDLNFRDLESLYYLTWLLCSEPIFFFEWLWKHCLVVLGW